MSVYKRRTEDDNKGKVVYNVGIVKGIVRLAVEDVAGVAIRKKKKNSILSGILRAENFSLTIVILLFVTVLSATLS